MNETAFCRRRDALLGLPLSHFWRGYGTALFLEFGDLESAVLNGRLLREPVGEMSIGLGWTWRIEDRSAILLGSASEDKKWTAVLGSLLGRKIATISLVGRIAELIIELDNGCRLQTFAEYEANSGWTISQRLPDGSSGLHLHWEAGALKESP
jgi:hypothetical protein